MRVLFVSSEVSPFAKTGGLADVALALPRALPELGVEIAVVMPKYRTVTGKSDMEASVRFDVEVAGEPKSCVAFRGALPETNVPVYFLGHDPYYDRPEIYGEGAEYEDALDRFTFLSRGALELCCTLDWIPDIIHVNDWHASLVPGYLRDEVYPRLSRAKTLLTIHNLGYQGSFPEEQAARTGLSPTALAPYLANGRINMLKGGIGSADMVNTVSPTYAEEILSEGAGLEADLQARRDVLFGVLNGIDMAEWNPAGDSFLWGTYDASDLSGKAENKRALQAELGLAEDPSTPVLGVVSRLAEQKGFDLIMAAFDEMMALDVQFVLLGTGAEEYERFFSEAQARYPGRVASLITFSEQWAHRIEAAVDVFLMPSHYEPCGLNQQYSLRYGTIPIVRATGGLKDTVFEFDAEADSGNGFLFEECTPTALLETIRRAVAAFRGNPDGWRAMMVRGMTQDLSWTASAKAYQDLYRKLGA